MQDSAKNLSTREDSPAEDPDVHIKHENTKSSTDKKCLACGGVMVYDPKDGKMLCEYCGNTEDIPGPSAAANSNSLLDQDHGPKDDDVSGTVMELDLTKAEHLENCDWGAKKKVVRCKSCGAESLYDALQVADSCPYCDSNQVMEEADENTLAPNGVCPFIITQEEARKRFKSWISGLWFRPNNLKSEHVVESFTGIYMPFWTFDSQTESTYKAEYGIEHTETDSDGNEHTETDWFHCSGSYSKFFDDVLIPATSRHDTRIIKGLEPFDTGKAVPYRPEYVAGYVAERYSVGLADGWKRGQKRIDGELHDLISAGIRRDKNADSVRGLVVTTEHSKMTYKYLLLPLWLSNFHYKNKVYHFMVNGRTGAVNGETPWSWWKIMGLVLVVIAVFYFLYSN